jgi:hypothetical protein
MAYTTAMTVARKTPGAKREPPLKIPMDFDKAIGTALSVSPPAEGWAEYEAKLKKRKKAHKAPAKKAR